VVAAVARDQLEPTGDLARDLDRVLVGLSAAEGEEDLGEAGAGQLEQPLGELDLGREDRVGGRQTELVGLALDRLDDPALAVAGVDLVGERAEVEPPLFPGAVLGGEPRPLPTRQLDRLGGALRAPGEEERVLRHGRPRRRRCG
jgi:hypothetical protein